MNRLLLSTALACVIAMPLSAANVADGETLAENQEYTFWLLDAIKTLDPQKNTDVEGSDILRQLFEGLYNDGQDGSPVPGVATRHDVSDDKLTYTFHLRDTAKWSNGDPVTAHDFVHAWRRLADPATASEYAWYIELMNVANAKEVVAGDAPAEDLGIRAVEDHIFEVTLSKPTPYFVKMLSHGSTFPAPQKVIEAHGADWTKPGNLVGNGAFKLDSHDLGVQITLSQNDHYWDHDKTVLTKVRALTVNDINVALTRYLSGELDRVDIPAGQFPRLKQEYPAQAISIPYSCSYSYLMNLSDKGPEALKDVRVRKALALSINRDVIVDQILQGGQKPAYNWTHWGIEGFEMPDIPAASLSQEERTAQAIALLEEAGYGPSNPLTLTLNYNTSEDHKKIAIAAQQMWKQIGVNVTLNNMEWKVHTDKMQNQDFELARYAWCADYNEASTFLDYFRTDGYNNGKFQNADYDALLDQAKTSENPNEQYKAAEQILAAELPLVPVYHYANVDMIRDDIRGLPTQNVMNNWYAKEIYRASE